MFMYTINVFYLAYNFERVFVKSDLDTNQLLLERIEPVFLD